MAEVLNLLQICCQSSGASATLEEKHEGIRASLMGLKAFVAPHVAMAELQGHEALEKQLGRYCLYFGEPDVKVERVESIAESVMQATASLSLTVTELTLRCVFPHLQSRPALHERLRDQRLHCHCSLSFLLDDHERVERLQLSVDWLAALAELLNSAEDTATVLNAAAITSECTLLDLHPK